MAKNTTSNDRAIKPALVILAPFGEEKDGVLTNEAKGHAETKQLIIEDLLKGIGGTVTVLFNENHRPSKLAAAIMTEGLPNIMLMGSPIDDLSAYGSFNIAKVLGHMEAHEHKATGTIILVASQPVCTKMLKCYMEAKGAIPPVQIEAVGPKEIYSWKTDETDPCISFSKALVESEVLTTVPA